MFPSPGVPGVGGKAAAEVLRQRAVAPPSRCYPQSGKICWYGSFPFYVDIFPNLNGPRPSEVMK